MRISDWSSDVCSSDLIGTPAEVYDAPANAFVFDFVGESNRIPVTAVDGKTIFRGCALGVDTNGVRGPAELFFRPHDARIGSADEAGIDAIVALVRPREGRVRVESVIDGVPGPIELDVAPRSEEHTSELQSLMRNSYAVL